LNNYAVHKKWNIIVRGNKTLPAGIILILPFFVSACFPILNPPTPITATSTSQVTVTSIQIPSLNKTGDQDLLTSLYERVNPGVVAIRVQTVSQDSYQGSGFVFDQKGNIVSNYHLVENAQSIEVDFADGYRAEAKLIGSDLDSDIAVIHVEVPPQELKPLLLGIASEVKVGQTVVAIGNPFGLSGTMTTGIVSALGRTLESLHPSPDGGYYSSADLIQTDASINPGNSGGPLLNLKGEVIGINRAIQTSATNQLNTPLNSGVGFAIPVSIVKKVVPALIEKGFYDYPDLGIGSREELTLQDLVALGVPTNTVGVYVLDVTFGGPADKAGLKGGSRETASQGLLAGGDWIVAIDGLRIMDYSSLISNLAILHNTGETITLTILRGGHEIQLALTLEKRPN
jgi:S1-C subfamily serine protease